jgi:hypothetical protein
VLDGIVGPLLATIVVLVPTIAYVKDHWARVGNVWATAVGASLLSSVLVVLL